MAGALRYGLVGCGRACERIHVPALLASGRVELAAAYDPAPEHAAWLRKAAPELALAGDLDELLATPGLNAVSVCTPNDQHADAVAAAAAAGVAVLCEKPLAESLAEGRRAARAVDAVGVPFALNLIHRFHPLLVVLLDALGHATTTDVLVEVATPGPRAWRPRTDWYGDASRAGGGALLDLGPHAIDVARQVLGEVVVTGCFAAGNAGDIEEQAVIVLASERGTGTVRLDRRARRFAAALECTAPCRPPLRLDFLAGKLSAGSEVLAVARDPRWMQAGVERFVCAAAGEDVAHVGTAEAVRLQELVADAYALLLWRAA